MKKVYITPFLFVLLLSLSACDETTTDTTINASTTTTTTDLQETVVEPAATKETAETVAFNSCDLLSTTDIQEIFPDATITITQQGDTANPIGQRICFYSASDTEMKYAQTSLIRTKDMSSGLTSTGQNAKSTFLNSKELVETPEDITDLGSQAYYGGSGLTLGGGLNILVNDDTSINISVGLGFANEDKEAHLTAEKNLAQKLLPQL